jgi:hypothetical protein
LREFDGSRLFKPSPLAFGESAHERREVRFMVFIVKPGPVPSPKRSLHRKVKETAQRASLETLTSDNFAVRGARLVFQKAVIFKQREVRRNP